ncbi:ribosome small subunit-dependent GTPase A [Frankia torreyi]|uniref:Small ribosomal subunit biogenesis GTPase RsgA n=2 Tax=Frankia TaxID=1854 RepID=A0A0D8BFJ8_9ACTN|nr:MULTISPECIES: ribosome small subunit-dependent GTPase A [Frankia]KJE22926.1 ribosome small subunit-dependent GTPase A [Frankia torreyi]KQC36904.1 GTPase [Frankia sp. ACN1ag]KQM04155.1 ribosome small subunit-dependent GTPase A [Frankia sp. CpI1-P]
MARELDEDDVRVRPGRSSRPRTRERPDHAEAVPAVVVGVDRGRYTCRPGPTPQRLVAAVRGGSMRRTSVVVGDRVALVGDVSGTSGALARLVRREERTSVLRRTPDDTDPAERPIVANADILVIVCSVTDPVPRPGLIDRCLVAAYDGGLSPVLCLTKTDLADPAPLIELYRPLGFPVLTTQPDCDLDPLLALLTDRVSVFFGHSGVGKSSLVNRLVPAADLAIGEVNAVTGRGRHTSSAAVALLLPGGGTVIDTPGVRSFGLGAVAPNRVLRAFSDLAAAAEHCQPGCEHLAPSPDCALDSAVRDGEADAARLASLRRLLAARGTPL